jgi:hypothetical protein
MLYFILFDVYNIHTLSGKLLVMLLLYKVHLFKVLLNMHVMYVQYLTTAYSYYHCTYSTVYAQVIDLQIQCIHEYIYRTQS